MSMKPAQLFRRTKHGTALTPQDVNNTTVTGPAINTPWREGSETRFLFHGGAWAAGTNLICKLQVQQLGGSWVDYVNPSAADIEFLQTKLDDAGAGEGATISGTINNALIDSATYKAVRVSVTNSNAGAALVAVTYEIFGLFAMEPGLATSAGIDDLWELQRA